MPTLKFTPREVWLIVGLTLLSLCLLNLPYLFAYATSSPDVFAGVIFHAPDGQSYLAKMREGWRGDWLFTLPHTAQPGPGVFLFTYFLFLGHLARWVDLRLDVMYHVARVVNGGVFLLSAYHFIAQFIDAPRQRFSVWLMFVFGSGLGWVISPLHIVSADFWVSDAFPFLTLINNAHFPLAWALLLWLLSLTLPGLAQPPLTLSRLGWIVLGVTLEGMIQPMALLTLSLILAGVTVGHWFITRHFSASKGVILIIVGLASAPWFINILWGMQINPQLVHWNIQNFSPSPPAWDALVAGGLPLGLAGLGCIIAVRRYTFRDQLLLFWFALQIMAIYAPVNLQRRLSPGLWMPLCLLASIGWYEGVAQRLKGYWRRGITALIIVGMLMTNLFVYATLWGMVYTRDAGLFFTPAEKAGLDWLATQADGKIVLASPAMGLFIPAWSDARVLYGHFLETVDAVDQERLVADFFSGYIADPAQFLQTHGVHYIFYGPRERALGPLPALPSEWQVRFQQGNVLIYGP